MKLRLHVDDYLTAIVAVALMRLQEWALNNAHSSRNKSLIMVREDSLEVSPEALDHLPEWYFHYLMAQYSVSSREKDKLTRMLSSRLNPKDKLQRLKDSINTNVKKLVRYYPDHPRLLELQQLMDEVKSLKLEQDAIQVLESIQIRYLSLLSTEEFEQKLTLNIIRSVLHNNFYGQTSMLQRTMSNYTLQQHIEKMINDFVAPVKLDIAIHEWIEDHPEPNQEAKLQLQDLLKESDRKVYKQWARDLKKMDPHDIPEYFKSRLRCSFEEEWLAAVNFEEMTFAPLGISGSSTNFSWNLDSHQMPISNWLRLLLFMAPVGLTTFTRLKQMPYSDFNKDEFETFYCFVYRDGTPQLIYDNNHELHKMEHNDSFGQVLPKLLQREVDKAKWEARPNIQLLEFHSDISIRKTVMNYYHVPDHVLRYLSSEKDKLRYIHRALREPFLKLILDSIDPISVIWNYMRRVISGKGSALSAYLAVQDRWNIEQLKNKEGFSMSSPEAKKQSQYIYFISREGDKIRRGLERRTEKHLEQTDYASSGNKRAAGVAHRLLNAARSGDKQQFIDTTLRLYLSLGINVPNSLLNVWQEDRVDFATWSGAFVAGLLGSGVSNPSDEQDSAVEVYQEEEAK